MTVLGVTGTGTACGEEIDRVLASVNGNIITRTDLRLAADLNLVLVLGKESAAAKSPHAELNRLVDLDLIRQELENFPLAVDDQSGIEAQIAELRQAYAEIGGLGTILTRLGLQESELESYIRLQASIKRFVILRFNPFVEVSESEITAYYRDNLVPRLKKEGAEIPPLAEVSKSIEELLTASEVNAALENWIKELRSHSKVEIFASGDETPSSAISAPGAGVAAGTVDKRPARIGRIQR
jgi:hypothetical protein